MQLQDKAAATSGGHMPREDEDLPRADVQVEAASQ